MARRRRRTCKETPRCVVSSAPVPPLRTLFPFVALGVISCVCRLARRHAQRSVRQRPRAEGMSRDPRVEHLERLHRQRRLRAAGHFSRMAAPGYGDVPQRSQLRNAGRTLFALVLLSIILGVLLSLPGHGDVRAWVHQLNHSLRVDRVGILPPTDGR